MALSTGTSRPRLATRGPGRSLNKGVKAATVAYAGGIACMEGAVVTPGRTATGLKAVGVFRETVDNSGGAAGDKRADIDADGAFGFANSAGGDEITEPGVVAYIVDDETVAATDGGSTRSIAGTVYDIRDGLVFVEFDHPTP